ncbi:hypothetical protein [Metapseudomonas otitidis]|uniref:hypothetical protein n=1 Tax=Metapseudomonas otitidis TaxID=319939 RepID=UPI000D1A335D|nr:hypothetical protein [Pseudomonas otitidis]
MKPSTREVEERIIRFAAFELISAGLFIRPHDGEGFCSDRTQCIETVVKGCFRTECTRLHVYWDGNQRDTDGPRDRMGHVLLVHGNGCDVVADNSYSLDAFLKDSVVLWDALQGCH